MASLTFEGGLNEQDVSLVNLAECISGYNFELGSKNTHFNPRKPFDYLGGGQNLLTRSEEFDHADWVKTGLTVSANAIAAPDGNLTADQLVEDTSTGEHKIEL